MGYAILQVIILVIQERFQKSDAFDILIVCFMDVAIPDFINAGTGTGCQDGGMGGEDQLTAAVFRLCNQIQHDQLVKRGKGRFRFL